GEGGVRHRRGVHVGDGRRRPRLPLATRWPAATSDVPDRLRRPHGQAAAADDAEQKMTARLFTIMGSGETAPTMIKVHRELLERVRPPAVGLDTPFGFQENADEIAAKAVAYFRESVGTDLAVATYRSSQTDDTVT